VSIEEKIKPMIELIAQRAGLLPPLYTTPEGRQRQRTIRLMFRRGYISEAEARRRLGELNMPPELISAVIEHELVERRSA